MPWLGIRHAGLYVCKTPDYVRAAIDSGEITAYRPRNQEHARWVVHTDDLDRWVRSWECSKKKSAVQVPLDGERAGWVPCGKDST